MTNLQVSNRKNNEQRIGKNIENTVENIRKKSVGIVCKVAKKISQKCQKKRPKFYATVVLITWWQPLKSVNIEFKEVLKDFHKEQIFDTIW